MEQDSSKILYLSLSVQKRKMVNYKKKLKITLPNLFSKSKWFVKFCHRYRAVLCPFYQSSLTRNLKRNEITYLLSDTVTKEKHDLHELNLVEKLNIKQKRTRKKR